MRKMQNNFNKFIIKLYDNLKLVIGSNYFFLFVVSLFVISASWIAVSFRYPFLFDERFHFDVIKIFSKQFSPIIYSQGTDLDMYGNLTFGNASIYHYILSYPYRLFDFILSNENQVIIALRLLNISLVAWGLYIYSKLFQEIGVSKALANISLLLFTLIPLLVFVSATISYDNMLFVVTAAFFLYGARIVSGKAISPKSYYIFILVGILGTLVKFTFIPVFVLGLGFVIFWMHKDKKHLKTLKASIRSWDRKIVTLLLIPFVLLLSLLIFRYGVSLAVYHTPLPRCDRLMSHERCLQNAVYSLENDARSTKNLRSPYPFQVYTQEWGRTMLLQLDTSAGVTKNDKIEIGKQIPVIATLLSLGVIIGSTVLIYQWKTLEKNTGWHFLIICSLGLVITLFIFNSMSYYSYNLDVNVQSKYLLSVTPVILAFATVATSRLLDNRRALKIVVLCFVIILATQGGGATKQLVNAKPTWYWDDVTIQDTNIKIKSLLSRLIKE